MAIEKNVCSHIRALENLKKSKVDYCVECVKIGDNWVHLRVCQTCGKTHCCDSSPNQHASKHYMETDHEVVTPYEKFAGAWAYCYKDRKMADVSNLK